MEHNPTELRSLAAEYSCIQLVYEWSSCEMSAVDIWKKEKDYGTCPDHEWFLWQLNEMQLPGSPVIPNLVLDQIECHMMSILKEVTDWIRYHHRKNFFHDESASPLKEYLLKLIWKPDRCWSGRSIDYAATAKNVLAGSTFNPMEKYRFACTYCFPEDVQNLREMAKVTIDWCFETEPFLVYWSKCLANQLHTIPVPANKSIDEIMFDKALSYEYYRLWVLIKYFFEKLNSGARLLQCRKDVLFNDGRYQKELLSLLNKREKRSVYRDIFRHVITNYEGVGDYESILQIYTELKGKLSFKNLAVILEKLAFRSMEGPEYFNTLTPLLMEMWNDAIYKDKREVISFDLRSSIRSIAEGWKDMIVEGREYYYNNRDKFRNPFVFIRALAVVYEPRYFLKSNFYWLRIWQPFASVLELIDEFQFTAEDIEELKNDIRQNQICWEYLAFGKFAEFSSFVSFCYSDDHANTISHQRELLIANLGSLSHALKYIDWRTVREFVNNLFRDTDDGSVGSYTTQLMQYVLKEGKHVLNLMEMIHREEANSTSIVECIEAFVPHDDDLSRAKKTLSDLLFDYLQNNYHFYYYYESFNFKETQFENMLIWCCGTETGVAKFKEKINVSECFVNQLRSCVVVGYTFEASDSMEEFLHWYYPIESERKAFKLEMIYSYGKFEEIRELLKERRYRRRMLNWFFENDAYKIMEFTTKIYV
ncbi:uncharacterized protein LOC135837926 [Planococcus citri]|uniref:uncharacterized protein LOC135837926 n=1 Tax=Planococcus citri TaxID=170843 RepID=UPI0031F792FC